MSHVPAASHWDLDPAVTYLNHGAFGAAPRAVLERQTELRRHLETNPAKFFEHDLPGLLGGARSRLAAFLGADPAQMAFVPNASTGVNAVLRSLAFDPGDEILITSHGYGAANNAAGYVANRSGATLVTAQVPMPIAHPHEVIDAVLATVTPATRLALIDHVTSATAVVFPVTEIVTALHDRGVRVLVDGAHAAGMLDLDVPAVGADFYTGNCHKWMCAPKGAGFLWVKEPAADEVVPVVVGWGRSSVPPGKSQFHADFDWVGTVDPTAYLAVPTAIDLLESLHPGGWHGLRMHNHDLVCCGRDLALAALGATAPVAEAMLGSMAALPLPPQVGRGTLERLLAERGIVAPVTTGASPEDRWLRISAQVYNSLPDYERLASALAGLRP